MSLTAAIMAFILSSIIECTASGAAIPAYQLAICAPFNIMEATGDSLMWLIALPIGGFVVYFVGKNVMSSEGSFKESKNALLKRAGAHFYNKGVKMLNESRVAQGVSNAIAGRGFRVGYLTPEGTMEYTFKTNRAFFYTLVNWCKRLEIYFGKNYTVTSQNTSDPDDEIGKPGYYVKYIQNDMKKYEDFGLLTKEIDDYKLGSVEKDEKRNSKTSGWCEYDKIAVERASRLLKVLLKMQDYLTLDVDEKPDAKKFIRDGIKEFGDTKDSFSTYTSSIGSAMGQYNDRFSSYGAHMVYKSLIMELTDQYNASSHTYRFANKEEQYKGAGTDTVKRTVQDYLNANKHLKEVHVDKYGRFFVDPSLKLTTPGPRKVHWTTNMTDMSTWMGFDWTVLIYDMRFGEYHQKSRGVNDYIEAHAKGRYDDNYLIPKVTGTLGLGNPAFDKRAFDDPGKLKTPGRTNYNDDMNLLDKGKMTDPTICTLGMGMYADDLIAFQIKDSEKAQEFMNRFPADSSGWLKKTVITKLSKVAEKSTK